MVASSWALGGLGGRIGELELEDFFIEFVFGRGAKVDLITLSCRGESESLSLERHNGVIFVAKKLRGIGSC